MELDPDVACVIQYINRCVEDPTPEKTYTENSNAIFY